MDIINIYLGADELSGALPVPRDYLLEIDRGEAMESRAQNEADLAMLACSPQAKDLQSKKIAGPWDGNKLLKRALSRLLVADENAFIALHAGHDFFVVIAEARRDDNGEPTDLQWDFLGSYEVGDVDRKLGMSYVCESFLAKREYLATAIAAGLYSDDGHVATIFHRYLAAQEEREREEERFRRELVSIVFQTDQARRMVQIPREVILDIDPHTARHARQVYEHYFAALACTENWAELEGVEVEDGLIGKVVLARSLVGLVVLDDKAMEAVRQGDDFIAIVAEATFDEHNDQAALEWDVLGSRKVGNVTEEQQVTKYFSRVLGYGYEDLKAALAAGRYRKSGIVGTLVFD